MHGIDKNTLKTLSEELIASHGSSQSALMPILNRLRTSNITIDASVMTMIADILHMAPSAIYGVVTFYSFLDQHPKGTHVIRVCQTISCEMAGAREVANALKTELGIDFGETTSDGVFTLEHTNCLGLCSDAPAMLLNETAHSKISAADIKPILTSIRTAMLTASN